MADLVALWQRPEKRREEIQAVVKIASVGPRQSRLAGCHNAPSQLGVDDNQIKIEHGTAISQLRYDRFESWLKTPGVTQKNPPLPFASQGQSTIFSERQSLPLKTRILARPTRLTETGHTIVGDLQCAMRERTGPASTTPSLTILAPKLTDDAGIRIDLTRTGGQKRKSRLDAFYIKNGRHTTLNWTLIRLRMAA